MHWFLRQTLRNARPCASSPLLAALACALLVSLPAAAQPSLTYAPIPLARPVHIDGSTPNPAHALVQALQNRHSVTLCEVDIDLTGQVALTLEAGQTIQAAAGCERSSKRLGPRVFVTDKREGGKALFIIRDNNVSIAGFRLQGPNAGIGSGAQDREYGIQVSPNADAKPAAQGAPVASHLLHDVRITNMEISQWSGAAIDLEDTQAVHPRGRMTLANAAGVLIENNYIHHNRHHDGFGYEVNNGKGAYALVRANVFEENRHAMAGDSEQAGDYSGYLFHDNLILPGGGQHCRESTPKVCWQTHQIDMHGTASETLFGEHCCGTAGETLLIERNTVLYRGGYRPSNVPGSSAKTWEWGLAIKIRGNPKGQALVDANVFALDNAKAAVAQNGERAYRNAAGNLVFKITKPVKITANNRWGAKPMDTTAKCDFDGDGHADEFMATGVTWWLFSAATQQWRYLNTRSEGPGQLLLKDMDGDGRCDVVLKPRNPAVAARTYSSGGTGPWVQTPLTR